MWASLPWAGGSWAQGLDSDAITIQPAAAQLALSTTVPDVAHTGISQLSPAAAQLTLSSVGPDKKLTGVYFADLERLASRSGDVTLRRRSGTTVVRARGGVATVDG